MPTHLLKHTASREGLGLQTCISHGHPRLAIILHLAALHYRRHRVERLDATAVRHQHGIAQAATDGAAHGWH